MPSPSGKLFKELNLFLSKYHLSATFCNVFTDTLAKFANINTGQLSFLLSKDAFILQIRETIYDDIAKLFAYLELPTKDLKFRDPIQVEISETIIKDKILPAFKENVAKIMAETPNEFAFYIRQSALGFASDAIKMIDGYLQDLYKLIAELDNTNPIKNDLVKFFYSSNGWINALNNNYEGYRHGINYSMVQKNLTEFNIEEIIAANKEIGELLKKISGELIRYGTYNRCDSAIAFDKFLKEKNDFLKNHDITADKCDIFIDNLLKLIGIESKSAKLSLNRNYLHPDLATFILTGLTEQEIEKFFTYFQNHKDDLVFFEKDRNSHIDKKPIEYTLEVDGRILYDRVLPDFKRYIEKLAAEKPDALKIYQKKSSLYCQSSSVHFTPKRTNSNGSGSIPGETKQRKII